MVQYFVSQKSFGASQKEFIQPHMHQSSSQYVQAISCLGKGGCTLNASTNLPAFHVMMLSRGHPGIFVQLGMGLVSI